MRADFSVPPPVMRGRIINPQPGHEEGQFCMRLDGRNETCLGTIWYQPDETLGGCCCFALRMPPCSYCMSTMSECDRCGYREEG